MRQSIIGYCAVVLPFQLWHSSQSLRAVIEQRKTLTDVVKKLQQIDKLSDMPKAAMALRFFPTDFENLPKGVADVRRRLDTISILSQEYQRRETLVGQLKVLRELRNEVEAFHKAMNLIGRPVGPTFL